MNSMKDLWDSVLKRLSHELSETTINTWFDEVTVVTMEDSAFVLHCSNTFKKSTIEARFLPHSWRLTTVWHRTGRAICQSRRPSPLRRMWWDPRTSWPLPPPRR